MILAEGSDHYRPTTWDAAFKLIGKTVNCLGSPNHAAFYTSGKTSNKAAFLYQLFAPAIWDEQFTRLFQHCHESSGCALLNVIGVGKGTVSLEDFEKEDAIFVIGQNPGTNHPRMLTACKRPSNAVARSPASMCFPRWASCDSPIPRISPPKRIGAIPVFPRLWPPTWAKPSQHA